MEQLVDAKHPIRQVKPMCDRILAGMDAQFDKIYAEEGRPSVPLSRLLMGWVLMALFSVRSCRQFAEQLRYNMLFKWFLDMNPDEVGFDASTFSKNMERFKKHHLSEHFSVDGTLIESWASLKSFRPKDEEPPPPRQSRNGWIDFKGKTRTNDTHESITDAEAKLLRKEAKLCFGAHAVVENRNGLLVHFTVRSAVGEGCTEPEVADEQLDEITARGLEPKSVGADKNYHTQEFVRQSCEKGRAPHVAQVKGRETPGLDGRTTGRKGYQMSQRLRKRAEEPFGWMKTVGQFRKSRWLGVDKTDFVGQFVAASCNLIRLARLARLEHDPSGPQVAAA